MTSRLRLFLPILVLTFRPPAAVATEAPAWELAGNYLFVHEQDGDGLNFPAGWSVSITGNVGQRFGITGEAAGSYKTEEVMDEVAFTAKVSLHSFQVGPRLAGHGNPGLTPYAQVLAGVTSAKITVSGLGRTASESESHFSIQPGVGADLRLSDRWAFGVGGDLRLIFVEDERIKDWRARAGFVYRVPRR